MEYPCQPSFFAENYGGSHKNWSGRPGNSKDFSNRHIFQTNRYMYKTIYSSMQYYLRPFQSCITIKCQYMGTHWKDHSNYFERGRPP